jgi:hypothetical protein
MKNLRNTLIALCLIAVVKLNAQNNHPTINKLQVSYKAVPQSTATAGLADIKCIPQATITLQPNSNVSKIYFTMLNPQTNAVEFQVNYSLSASPVINSGVKLFEVTNGVVYLSSGQTVSLKPFLYQIQTSDSQNNLTTVYTVTK